MPHAPLRLRSRPQGPVSSGRNVLPGRASRRPCARPLTYRGIVGETSSRGGNRLLATRWLVDMIKAFAGRHSASFASSQLTRGSREERQQATRSTNSTSPIWRRRSVTSLAIEGAPPFMLWAPRAETEMGRRNGSGKYNTDMFTSSQNQVNAFSGRSRRANSRHHLGPCGRTMDTVYAKLFRGQTDRRRPMEGHDGPSTSNPSGVPAATDRFLHQRRLCRATRCADAVTPGLVGLEHSA